jgi:hypothetical protein
MVGIERELLRQWSNQSRFRVLFLSSMLVFMSLQCHSEAHWIMFQDVVKPNKTRSDHNHKESPRDNSHSWEAEREDRLKFDSDSSDDVIVMSYELFLHPFSPSLCVIIESWQSSINYAPERHYIVLQFLQDSRVLSSSHVRALNPSENSPAFGLRIALQSIGKQHAIILCVYRYRHEYNLTIFFLVRPVSCDEGKILHLPVCLPEFTFMNA